MTTPSTGDHTTTLGPKPGNVTEEIIAAMDQSAPRFDEALATALAATTKALDMLGKPVPTA